MDRETLLEIIQTKSMDNTKQQHGITSLKVVCAQRLHVLDHWILWSYGYGCTTPAETISAANKIGKNAKTATRCAIAAYLKKSSVCVQPFYVPVFSAAGHDTWQWIDKLLTGVSCNCVAFCSFSTFGSTNVLSLTHARAASAARRSPSLLHV